MTTTTNYFAELYAMDVSKHVEKKGKFSYLSWTYAVSEMCKFDPTANWEVIRFNGMPFIDSQFGVFVEVAVTIKGFTKSQIHPVLDGFNKAVEKPSAFQINTSIQRCLVKAIALHGLGLCVYNGEDLPEPKELTSEDYKELWLSVKNRSEFESLYHRCPEIIRKGLIEVIKEISLKYPKPSKDIEPAKAQPCFDDDTQEEYRFNDAAN